MKVDFVVLNRINNQIGFDNGMGEAKFEETKKIILFNRLKKSFKKN
jgi:hypothetical protein